MRHWNPEQLVFLDESGLNTKMARRYGRALQNQRCLCFEPHGHWSTSTFIAGLRVGGLSAPLLLDGPMNGDAFLAYVQQHLGPTLSRGDIVICDNLSCHKVKGVREAIESTGAELLYLPPYSPDLNPIEMAFSKLKAHLRESAPRCLEEIISQLAIALDLFTPAHCANFFKHAQYAAL